MAWDEDGTIFVHWQSTTALVTDAIYTSIMLPGTEYTVAEKGFFNNERTTTPYGSIPIERITFAPLDTGGHAFAVIFPEPRDIWGMSFWGITYRAGDDPYWFKPVHIQTSSNSTNGISGTWSTIYTTDYPLDVPYFSYTWDLWYRIGIVAPAAPLTNVRILRFAWAKNLNATTADAHFGHMHLYGDKSTGATPDRLLFIDNDTGLEFTGPLDWGDVPRGTVLHHDIKIKNNSATLTANTIVLDFETLTGVSDQWHTMSDSGGAFGGTVNITSIAPTAVYPAANVITIKLTVGNSQSLGPNSSRLQASTVSWT